MKLQLTPKFPALVVGQRGISVTIANAVYTFSLASPVRIVTVPGPVLIGSDDVIVVIRKTLPEVTAVQLPLAGTLVRPITICDGGGVWGNFNATITPANAETIAGLANIIGDTAWQVFTLIPIPNVGFAIG